MSKTVITPTKEKFIIANYLNFSSRKLAEKLDVSKFAILNCLKRNNLKVPKEITIAWRAETLRKPYTKKEHDYIIANIEHMNIKNIAKELGRGVSRIYNEIHTLGLTEIIEQKKAKSQFQKGLIPPNKGKKMEEFMTPEQIKIFKSNQFKKNSIPHNALEDYTEVERQDNRTGRVYILVKVPGKRKLQFKHRHIWEQHHKKKIPAKYHISFIDNDTTNFEITNLECISNKENMSRNTLHQYPQELKELLYLKGAVTRQINKHKKNENRNDK